MENIEKKLSKLLNINNLNEEKLKDLSQKELTQIYGLITSRLDYLEDPQWAQIVKNIEALMQPKAKNILWEKNHSAIQQALASYISEHGRMPSKTELAEYAGLSRYTIHKHFKEYMHSATIDEQKEHYQLSITLVVDSLLKAALKGNVKAGITYLQLMGQMPGGKTTIQTQNNIQLNKTVINQQTIQQLKPEQLKQIEQIINENLPDATEQEATLQQPPLHKPFAIGEVIKKGKEKVG